MAGYLIGGAAMIAYGAYTMIRGPAPPAELPEGAAQVALVMQPQCSILHEIDAATGLHIWKPELEPCVTEPASTEKLVSLLGAAMIAYGAYKMIRGPAPPAELSERAAQVGLVMQPQCSILREIDAATGLPIWKPELEPCVTEPALTEKLISLLDEAGARKVEREWSSDFGVGDLVFEFRGKHLVIEVKYRSTKSGHAQREHRRQQRRDVIEQAKRYADAWKRKHPEHSVVACICTNLNGLVSAPTARGLPEDA